MSGPISRWFTDLASKRIRRTGRAPGLGFNALVLTTIGRKSGLKRTTPVGWSRGEGGSYPVVAFERGSTAESGLIPQPGSLSRPGPCQAGATQREQNMKRAHGWY